MSHRKGGKTVDTQMKGGFPQPSMTGAKGIYDRGPGPFDKPRSMGNGAVPTKFCETGISKGPTPTQTAGMLDRTPRPGTKQRAYGTTDT